MEIADVSDTALWVATYRAEETERPDALFRDPLAGRLAGERGREIAKVMTGGRYTAWSIVIRTCIIDSFILNLIPQVDVILNLGAGLDTRPYRLDFPDSVRWVEVDYPHMIALKNERLASEKPRCRLERVALDLADRPARVAFLEGFRQQRVLVLTEGVIPYLSEDDVASLARDLKASGVRHWISDYISPLVMRFLQRGKRRRQMKNAPFRFNPADWFGFFSNNGWKPKEIRYYAEESEKLGRGIPRPWWSWLFVPFMSAKKRKAMRTMSGYVLWEPT